MMLVVWLVSATMAAFGEEPLPVSMEQLAKGPSDFQGKLIRIDGAVVSSEEGSIIRLRRDTQEVEGLAILVVLSPTLARKPDRAGREFSKLLRQRGKAIASLDGRLEVAPYAIWGHQLCCRLRLEVARVHSVRAGH